MYRDGTCPEHVAGQERPDERRFDEDRAITIRMRDDPRSGTPCVRAALLEGGEDAGLPGDSVVVSRKPWHLDDEARLDGPVRDQERDDVP